MKKKYLYLKMVKSNSQTQTIHAFMEKNTEKCAANPKQNIAKTVMHTSNNTKKNNIPIYGES